jgi:hypothetical protein
MSKLVYRKLSLAGVAALVCMTGIAFGAVPKVAHAASALKVPHATAPIAAHAARTIQVIREAPPPSGCPQIFPTKTANFAFAQNTATVAINLYWSPTANGGHGCFNGYERIFVSSGSGVFGSNTLDSDWLQYWYSTNNGASYNWMATPPETCYFGTNAAALLNFSNSGQCGSAPEFTFPNSSMAWVESNDWGFSSTAGVCVLIQNSPNISQYGVPETVWNSTNTRQFQVPNVRLTTCTG